MAEASESAGKAGGFLKAIFNQCHPFGKDGHLFRTVGIACSLALFNIIAAPASAIAASTHSIGGIFNAVVGNAWSGFKTIVSGVANGIWSADYGAIGSGLKTAFNATSASVTGAATTNVVGTGTVPLCAPSVTPPPCILPAPACVQ